MRGTAALTLPLWGPLALALAACAPEAETPRRQIMPELTGRPLCGWDELMGRAPDVTLESALDGATLPAQPVVSLRVADDVRYGDVGPAIRAAAATLVRLKLVIDERWLLEVTVPPAEPPPKPRPEEAFETTIGHRKITRHVQAPRERFADVRVDGAEARLFVENEAPGGEVVPLAALADALRAQRPPVGVIAITAEPDTRWRELSRAIIAAACFDREPGDAPHEVILD